MNTKIIDELKAALSTRERLVVQLYWNEELTLAEIAAVLGLDEGHVGAVLRTIVEKATRVVSGPRVESRESRAEGGRRGAAGRRAK